MRLIFSAILLAILSLPAPARSYYFRHYRNDNGLPNNTVSACIQDKKGFMWFGTKEGLARFDGFQFKVFLHNDSSSNSVINNYITSLAEDRDGWIWIGTTDGICYYIPESDYFGTITAEGGIKGMISEIAADNNGYVWVRTIFGLFRYDKKEAKLNFYSAREHFFPGNIIVTSSGEVWVSGYDGMIHRYEPGPDNFSGFRILDPAEVAASVQIIDIVDAVKHGLIIATTDGLRKFNPNSGKVTKLFLNDNRLRSEVIRTTCMSGDDEIWIGTESGIFIYSLESGFRTNLQMIRTDPFSLSNNAIRTITRDREGGIWVGTFYGGVNYLPFDNKPFEKYYPTGLPGSLGGTVIREIRSDSNGNIWVGSEDAGLYKFDVSAGIFESMSDKIPSKNIQGLLVDNDILWVGTYNKGIYTLDTRSESVTGHFEPGRGNGLNTGFFITFLKTSDGAIFAGSANGVYTYNRSSSTFRFLEDVAPGAFIHALLEDSRGIIWVGTYGRGLYRYDRSTGICLRVTDENINVIASNAFITSIFEDNRHQIWFTTEGNGISYIDNSTGIVTRYMPASNIDLTIFSAILQDGSGNMWVTSTRGLLKIDQSPDSITLFTKEDGLLDNTFSYNSAYKDRNGKMYFGTMSGLISFNPVDIKPSISNLPVYFTGIQVNGREYFNNSGGDPDFKSALVTGSISLRHHQSSLSIDFVSPGFTSPGLTRYRYMMEGSDPGWVTMTGNRRVYYTNLSPGEYFFRVQSSADGITWNNAETSLCIRISPPVLLSIPAMVFYFILLSFFIYLVLRFYNNKSALEQQRKIDIIESRKEKELLNAKINFFTNITHEVRTPLTLIKGPLDRILKSGLKGSREDEEHLLIIKRSTERLLNLTNQLLDFRKTEKEMFRLNFIRTEIYELVESTFNLFQPYAAERMISFRLHSPVKHFVLAVDREAITKILSNLLSNALRYAESKVDLYIEPRTEKEDMLRIRVVNDGNLIPGSLSEKIFEPFYQVEFDKPGEKGAGLGLSLARSLTELHHGRLYYDTSERTLNSFVLELALSQQETITSVKEQEDVSITERKEEYEVFGSIENSRPNILLVEDEIEMGKFIAQELSGEYNVILTHNGRQALEALIKYNIILVVSDVIMPVINGYDLCRQIKSNIEFSHIPVILLTATIHLNARIEGLDSGADAYIEKPFSTELLQAQIVNLIKNRSLERQNFINSPLTHFRSVALNKTDEEFLRKLHSTIMDNISENDLSVEKIAELMGVSVSTLYRKVKALTDLNTVEFIRLTKLKKAAELLSEGNYRINEISFLVGFSSPSYFATSFQKQFGISPSQFVKKLK